MIVGAISIAVKENELETVLNNLKTPPKIVVTDSQAFKKVSEIVPKNIFLNIIFHSFCAFKGRFKYFL